MRYHGIDPSSDYTGYAAVEPNERGPPHLSALLSVRLGDDQPATRLAHHLVPHIRASGPPDVWSIERPPPSARKDARHGWQALIGYHTGYVGGVVCGLVLATHPGATIHTPEPTPWRTRMLALSASWGTPLPDPRRRSRAPTGRPAIERVDRRADGSLIVTWQGCGHEWMAPSLALLQLSPPTVCTTCQPRPTSRAEAVRDAWKATAVDFVRAYWPAPLAELEAAARGRAKHKRKPAHQLAGVADACEAVGIACFKLE